MVLGNGMYKCDSCTFEWSNDSGRMPRSCPSELCPNPKMWNALTEDKNKRNQITRMRRRQGGNKSR